MFGLRRYRLFLLVAALTAGTLYYLARGSTWDNASLGSIRQGLAQDVTYDSPAFAPVVPPPAQPPVVPDSNGAGYPQAPKQDAPSLSTPTEPKLPAVANAHTSKSSTPSAPSLTSSSTSSSSSSSTRLTQPVTTGEELLQKTFEFEEEFANQGQGRAELPRPPKDGRRPVWTKPKPNFPLPADQLILMPTGKAQKLPKVQASFFDESSAAKKERMGKLNAVKESFKHAWKGYKEFGLPHDEVKPMSKSHADPFMGWGATLVDSLDTLWIMGLKEDFADAVQEVEKIDFKTSLRKDIPLFETVIRYLGGLVAAYDLSNHKYPALLLKAEELAEILMGAFDTPNRMPITFYNWSPSYATQPHRASAHSVMSELGSLSLEFTRLAQITQKSEYYDAVARITDELEKLQMNTLIPGLWPLKLDASGCKKSEHSIIESSGHDDEEKPILLGSGVIGGEVVPAPAKPAMQPAQKQDKDITPADKKRSVDGLEARADTKFQNRTPPKPKQPPAPPVPLKEVEHEVLEVDCEPQPLATEPNAHSQKYAMGGQADSTYEYFPKMHALLGGRLEQYRNMYVKSADAIRDKLLFRPMIEDHTRSLLFAAKYELAPQAKNVKKREIVTYEATHLGCFLGGMFALGSKYFGISSDMNIAQQLTDGCVWAYESMPAGIMAEAASLVPCEQMSTCAWNETRWHEHLDPLREERLEAVEMWNTNQKLIYEKSQKQALKDLHDAVVAASGPAETGTVDKEDSPPPPRARRDVAAADEPSTTIEDDIYTEISHSINADSGPIQFVPKVALSHKKYVTARIQEERLPPGYTRFFERKYFLRPEAIESVFYMYRVTGDEEWRNKGWKMFEAIQSATQTEIGNAAVSDVTSLVSEQMDNMESFWLSETLKYFYLLFSDPAVISLDDFVFNTEAHPFRIPK